MKLKRQRAFTLVEAVVVMVVIGILAGIVAVFIRAPVQGFVDSAGRAELTDVADLALRRMARDLRSALPNSVRVASDGHAIEFLATVGGGRYVAADDGVDDPAGPYALDFVDPSKVQFTVANPMPDLTTWIGDANYVAVYNLGPDFEPSNAYFFDSTPAKEHNIAKIAGKAFDGANLVTTITLADNPFARQTTPMPSPTHRFQLVSGPVMYSCENRNGVLTLVRAWNYHINAAMAATAPTDAGNAVMASGVSNCTGLFKYDEDPGKRVVLQRSALVVISLALNARNTNDPPVRLVHQVHIDNTP